VYLSVSNVHLVIALHLEFEIIFGNTHGLTASNTNTRNVPIEHPEAVVLQDPPTGIGMPEERRRKDPTCLLWPCYGLFTNDVPDSSSTVWKKNLLKTCIWVHAWHTYLYNCKWDISYIYIRISYHTSMEKIYVVSSGWYNGTINGSRTPGIANQNLKSVLKLNIPRFYICEQATTNLFRPAKSNKTDFGRSETSD